MRDNEPLMACVVVFMLIISFFLHGVAQGYALGAFVTSVVFLSVALGERDQWPW